MDRSVFPDNMHRDGKIFALGELVQAALVEVSNLKTELEKFKDNAAKSERQPMAHEIIHNTELSEPAGVFVQATRVPAGSDVIHVSGLTSRNKDGSTFAPNDIKAQTRHILKILQKILANAGASIDDVAKVTVYITNMDDFDTIHEVRREFFINTKPASAMVEVSRLVHDDMLIEIEAVAYVMP